MNTMQNRPKPYELFYLDPPDQHANLACLSMMLWHAHFSAKMKSKGEDDYLDDAYYAFFVNPEEANLQLCPYYFDQVSDSLLDFHQTRRRSWDSRNLQLRCFDSWASVRAEITKAFLSETDEQRNRVPFSYRCRPVTRNPSRILSSKLHLSTLRGFPSS